MIITEAIEKYSEIIKPWEIKRLIGEGSFGSVFEVNKSEFGTVYKAALKIIHIPKNEDEIRQLKVENLDDEGIKTYYSDIAHRLADECAIMSKFKGNSNIVSYEDHKIIEGQDGISWDILIRMELLTPLKERLAEGNLSEKEVVKLGIGMCNAIELCHGNNIIHRDIKPENIFISQHGDYKLGDFGIARTVESTSAYMSRTGTELYMAPEILKSEPYGFSADIYALGLVMYNLLNGNRAPFLPPAPASITFTDKEESKARILAGEQLPPPAFASDKMAEVILKACSYSPRGRYLGAAALRQALEEVEIIEEEVPQEATVFCRNCGAELEIGTRFCDECGAPVADTQDAPAEPTLDEFTIPPQPDDAVESDQSQVDEIIEAPAKKNNSKVVIAIVAAIILVAGAVTGIVAFKDKGDNNAEANPPVTDEIADESEAGEISADLVTIDDYMYGNEKAEDYFIEMMHVTNDSDQYLGRIERSFTADDGGTCTESHYGKIEPHTSGYMIGVQPVYEDEQLISYDETESIHYYATDSETEIISGNLITSFETDPDDKQFGIYNVEFDYDGELSDDALVIALLPSETDKGNYYVELENTTEYFCYGDKWSEIETSRESGHYKGQILDPDFHYGSGYGDKGEEYGYQNYEVFIIDPANF